MSPEEPGAPDDAQRDAGTTASTDPAPRAQPPDGPEPRKVVAPTARRRFLDDPDPDAPKAPRAQRVRHRKVRRVVRHIEPWSVLKISVLFFASIFLIICVASVVLWNAARGAGVIDDVEGAITSLAAVGDCVDVGGEDDVESPATSTTIDASQPQLGGSTTTVAEVEEPPDQQTVIPDDEGECPEGTRLVGGFEFEDVRIIQSFALGGIVLVLAGAGFSVVMAMLFNLISDLTGGVRVTVLEEEPAVARRPPSAEGAADRGPAA
jgi:hypothetical protein